MKMTSAYQLIKSYMYIDKRYFIIDQQIACHFVHFGECYSNFPSLLCNSDD